MENGASYVAMVLVQLAYGGSTILMKIALEKVHDQLVFIVYGKQRPSLSFKVMAKIFVLSSLGTTIHLNVYYAGLAYTSATFASALSNVVPCFNGGYLIRSLLKKPLVSLHDTGQASDVLTHRKENWIKGSLLILISHIAWSAWLILQAVVYEAYPARLSLAALICFFASLQSLVLSLFFARNRSLWKLEVNVQLWTIIYCGVVISSLVYYLQTWCISRKGPVFAAMFSPLLLMIVGIFSAVAFKEQFHMGNCYHCSGAVLCVLWGKRKESLYNARGTISSFGWPQRKRRGSPTWPKNSPRFIPFPFQIAEAN
ncbi:hypothetical protein ACJRO7_018971 [Eucalyptus globulus]|uniref:WAT1-related protein n=1 Tax=Eucalyptus globulus TaxID=34317 RepID=A0ABD3KZM5_EUCGL